MKQLFWVVLGIAKGLVMLGGILAVLFLWANGLLEGQKPSRKEKGGQ